MILNHLLEQEQENRVKEARTALAVEAHRQTELTTSGERDGLMPIHPRESSGGN